MKGVKMLVLSRQRDETIMIGDDIEVTVVDIRGDKVRLGINAPKEISIHRREVYDSIRRKNLEAAQVKPEDLSGFGKITPKKDDQVQPDAASPVDKSPEQHQLPEVAPPMDKSPEQLEQQPPSDDKNPGGQLPQSSWSIVELPRSSPLIITRGSEGFRGPRLAKWDKEPGREEE
jgi:carbon storage regulator